MSDAKEETKRDPSHDKWRLLIRPVGYTYDEVNLLVVHQLRTEEHLIHQQQPQPWRPSEEGFPLGKYGPMQFLSDPKPDTTEILRIAKKRNKEMHRAGIPEAIGHCFTDIKLATPYKLLTYGKLEINNVVAHKVIDYKLDQPSTDGKSPARSKKMQAVLCCERSKGLVTVRISCLPEDNDATCTIWRFQNGRLTAFDLIFEGGQTISNKAAGGSKAQHEATVKAICELLA